MPKQTWPKKIALLSFACLILLGGHLWYRLRLRTNNAPRPTEKISFLAVGDTGTGEEAQIKVSSSMKKVCEAALCDAVFLLGDVIYDKGVTSVSDSQFKTKFEDPYEAINVPFYVALGNHDYQGCKECYKAYGQSSTKWRFPDYYYKESFGSVVDVFVLDTEEFGQEQTDWLEKELANSTAAWKIAAGHHPIYTNSKEYKDAYPEKKALLKKAICNNFDFYLAGHSHGLEYLGEVCGVGHLVSGGGGAPLYEILPNSSPFWAESYGFVLITADERTLSASFYNEKEEPLYSFEKNK